MGNTFKLILFSVIIAAGCNNTEDAKSTSAGIDSIQGDSTLTTIVTSKEDLVGCYGQIYERDTSSLQLQIKSDSLTGQLVYKIFEKDRNDGMFKGEFSSNQLAGWYYFKSEGIMSVRQVVWKIYNGQLWPAMGEMKIKNDTMIFSDLSALKYDSTHPFVKTNCVE